LIKSLLIKEAISEIANDLQINATASYEQLH